MEYFAYNQLIHNTLPYRDLDARIRQGIKDITRGIGHVMYVYGHEKKEKVRIEAWAMYPEAIEGNPDNVYSINAEDYGVDCIAYEIESNSIGFYTCRAIQHGVYDPKPYTDYLSHRDIIGVLYKGYENITYKNSIMSCGVGCEPLYLYMRYPNS